MTIKVIWDFTLYWSGIAQLFFRNKLCDLAFMQSTGMILQQIYQLNSQMQGFFRHWAEVDNMLDNRTDIFLNYSNIGFIQQLNKDLHKQQSDDQLQQQLSQNIVFVQELSSEIAAEATKLFPELKEHAPEVQDSRSNHLQDVFTQLGSRL